MDNGTEFKNNLFSRVAEQLGVERKISSPPYRPQSNGRIEVFHKFLKSCLAKHISRHREWDNVVPLATASYNWLPVIYGGHCILRPSVYYYAVDLDSVMVPNGTC